MPPAVDQRLEGQTRAAAPDVQRADALRAAHLVRRERQQVDAQRVHVDRRASRRLRGVGVQQDAARPRQLRDARQRLQDADLVVGGHDRHQPGVGPQRALDVGRVAQAVRPRRHARHLDALAFEAAARIEHRVVLGGHRHDVQRPARVRRRHAPQREVVGFGGAAREADLPRVGADQAGHLPARGGHRVAGGPAERVVAARGVAEAFTEERQHRLDHPGVDGRRRVVIQVDGRLAHGVADSGSGGSGRRRAAPGEARTRRRAAPERRSGIIDRPRPARSTPTRRAGEPGAAARARRR